MPETTLKIVLLINSKSFNQISNFLLPKKLLFYLLAKNMLWEATSNLSVAFFHLTMKKTHFRLLIQADSEEQSDQFFPFQKCFGVPFIFICFKYLVSPAKNVKENGDIFDNIKLALTYSSQQPVATNLDLLDFTAILTEILLAFYNIN